MDQCVDVSADFVVEDDIPARSSTPAAGRPIGRPAPRASGPKHHAVRSGGKHAPQPAAAGSTAGEEAEVLDPHKLQQRQKQVDYGKNTIGYQRYTQLVPRENRTKRDPVTPDISQPVSKRCFDGQVKAWRRLLHQFDEGMPQAQAVGLGAGKQAERDTGAGAEDQDQGDQGCPSPSSRGSLEGYFPPSAANKKRGHSSAFKPTNYPTTTADISNHQANHPNHQATEEAAIGSSNLQQPNGPDSCERQTKRSTASRSSLHEHGQERHTPLASTAGTAGHTLGSGSVTMPHVATTTAGGVCGVVRPGVNVFGGPAVAAKHNSPQPCKPDNVLSLILGGENGSRMSWAADGDEMDAVGL